MAKRSHRIRWIIALALLPAASALSRSEPEPAVPSKNATSSNQVAFFGNAGCAASGCHNGNGSRDTPGSEYSTWANKDPHSRAFGVLQSAAGQQMERLYRRDAKADAGKDQLCLKCHAPLGADPERTQLRSDAVGCEACHGSSTQWRTTHYQNSWKSLGADEKVRRGMTDTKDLAGRIERCVECHVGKPGMDVDHDLIAAGHPRLFFEYAAYHDLLPRHWTEKDQDAFHARAWAIGRVTAAKAAVQLLCDRAAIPNRWPELAEYNCYSCHRGLSDTTSPPTDRPPGSLAAGSWHFGCLDVIAKLGDAYAPSNPVDPKTLLQCLHQINAKPADIVAAAKPLAAALGAWQDKLKSAGGIDLGRMKKLLGECQPPDWEQATQQYLAISAWQRSLPMAEQKRDGLMRLRDLLKFTRTDTGSKINSPARFNLADYRAATSALLTTAATKNQSEMMPHHAVGLGSITSTLVLAHSPIAMPTDGQVPGASLVTAPGPNENNAGDCKNCHAREMPEYKQRGVYDFIHSHPSMIWEENDPHSKAWVNIVPQNNAIAQRMAQTLGYDVSRKPECLVCHAVDATPREPLMAQKGFAWKYGVGCEACHGDAEKWFEPHRKETWRKVEPEKKEAEFGLVDLRDPARRAAKCASCHIGNVAEGKSVTHEMYAAGHPPLLPFEPVTFGRDQPAHWRLPKDVPYIQALNDGDAKRLFHAPKDEDYVARSLAVGAIVNLRETAKTVAAAAAATPDGAMLDFAHFDCFACHHELVLPSQRQARGYAGTPGRPTLRTMPTELAAAVLGQLPDKTNGMNSAMGRLNGAFDSRAFGKPADVAAAANQLAVDCDQWLKQLDAVRYNEAGKQQLLAALQQAGSTEHWDYDTAQQLAWALRALKAYDRIGDEWNPLRKHLLLDAGLGPNRRIDTSLKDRLRLRYDFDPRQFAENWKQLIR